MKITTSQGPRALLGLADAAAIISAAVVGSGANANASSKLYFSHVTIVNLSDQSFGVTFTTSKPAPGARLTFGTTCAKATKKAHEVKSNGSAHLINLPGGLAAGTSYAFKLAAGGTSDNNKGKCFGGKTLGSTTVPPPPATIYGSVTSAHKCDPAIVGKTSIDKGSLVMLTVSHSGLTSTPLAAIADSKGRWAIPFSEATDYQGHFMHLSSGDPITYTATVSPKHTDTDHISYNGSDQIIGPEQVCVA